MNALGCGSCKKNTRSWRDPPGISRDCGVLTNQDPPCTLNWGYMVPNSGYLGPKGG